MLFRSPCLGMTGYHFLVFGEFTEPYRRNTFIFPYCNASCLMLSAYLADILSPSINTATCFSIIPQSPFQFFIWTNCFIFSHYCNSIIISTKNVNLKFYQVFSPFLSDSAYYFSLIFNFRSILRCFLLLTKYHRTI